MTDHVTTPLPVLREAIRELAARVKHQPNDGWEVVIEIETRALEAVDALAAGLRSCEEDRIAAYARGHEDGQATADKLAEALREAVAVLAGEGYDQDPDYAPEWRAISTPLAEYRGLE